MHEGEKGQWAQNTELRQTKQKTQYRKLKSMRNTGPTKY